MERLADPQHGRWCDVVKALAASQLFPGYVLSDDSGLEVDALYGGFAHEPFTEHSKEYVFVARRR